MSINYYWDRFELCPDLCFILTPLIVGGVYLVFSNNLVLNDLPGEGIEEIEVFSVEVLVNIFSFKGFLTSIWI